LDSPALDVVTYLQGKTVAVTGAGGSIGSHVSERIVRAGARAVKLISITESSLYNVTRHLRTIESSCEIKSILGSVSDRWLMQENLEGVDVVIHAAAHKHVPICELNPMVAIENNIFGTFQLTKAAVAAGVSQFVLVSTDKAVNPISVMGATKRVAELIVRDIWNNAVRPNFFSVRFGNVLDSSGSVLPLWREQIRNGGPVTVTHPDCIRYFMSIDEAADLILGTVAMRPQKGTFIFDMGKPRRMMDIAEEMIQKSGIDIEMKFIGLRPGEKIVEELYHGGELEPTSHPKIFRVDEKHEGKSLILSNLNELQSAVNSRDSAAALLILRRIAQ